MTWWLGLRDNVARHLLAEALRVRALKEAWIVVGAGARDYEFTSTKQLPLRNEFSDDGDLALCLVEVRAVLDQPKWSLPKQLFHAFIDGRRTWVVRAKLTIEQANSGSLKGAQQASRPAILSSRALEELVAWIEQVASSRSWKSERLLSNRGLRNLLPLTPALAAQDRRQVLETFQLSDTAKAFLENYSHKHPLRIQ